MISFESTALMSKLELWPMLFHFSKSYVDNEDIVSITDVPDVDETDGIEFRVNRWDGHKADWVILVIYRNMENQYVVIPLGYDEPIFKCETAEQVEQNVVNLETTIAFSSIYKQQKAMALYNEEFWR